MRSMILVSALILASACSSLPSPTHSRLPSATSQGLKLNEKGTQWVRELLSRHGVFEGATIDYVDCESNAEYARCRLDAEMFMILLGEKPEKDAVPGIYKYGSEGEARAFIEHIQAAGIDAEPTQSNLNTVFHRGRDMTCNPDRCAIYRVQE